MCLVARVIVTWEPRPHTWGAAPTLRDSGYAPAINGEPRFYESHSGVKRTRAHALLPGDSLYHPIDPLDVRCATKKCARHRGRAHQTFRCRRIFFERHKI